MLGQPSISTTEQEYKKTCEFVNLRQVEKSGLRYLANTDIEPFSPGPGIGWQ